VIAAVVDIGSNSTRLLIASTEGGRIRELERRSEITRLGAGVDAAGRLREDAIARVLATLDRYRELIDAHCCERTVAVMTSAVRDASNGEALARLVQERYGLRSRVLSGEDEARLTYLGAVGDLAAIGDPSAVGDPAAVGAAAAPGSSTRTLVIDIGGGSTELVAGAGGEIELCVSTQAGVVRQTERHLRSDPPTEPELLALRADVHGMLHAAVPSALRGAVDHAVAVAGTATSLAAIAQRLDPYDPARVEGHRLSAQRCGALLSELAALPLERRREVPGLHPDRAPTIVAGAAILLEAMSVLELEQVTVSERDLLYGALIKLCAD